MNNVRWAFFAIVLIAAGVANFLPYVRGKITVQCENVISRPTDRLNIGLPFGYYTRAVAPVDCTFDSAIDPNGPRNMVSGARFNTAAAWFDLIIDGGLVVATYFMLDYRKAKT